MSERRFEVIFRGDVVPGQSVLEVKSRLAELFGVPPAKVEQMFSGRPVVIKRDLDEGAAARYRAVLKDAGALVDIRPVESVAETGSAANRRAEKVPPAVDGLSDPKTATAQSGSENSEPEETIGVAPMGADILLAEYRKDFTPREVDTSHMTVQEPGADVLKEDEKSPSIERDVDTSHLSVKDPE